MILIVIVLVFVSQTFQHYWEVQFKVGSEFSFVKNGNEKPRIAGDSKAEFLNIIYFNPLNLRVSPVCLFRHTLSVGTQIPG